MGLDDLMDINPVTIGLTVVLYAFCMLVLWKFGSGLGDWRMIDKTIISILALPILYVCVAIQMNR